MEKERLGKLILNNYNTDSSGRPDICPLFRDKAAMDQILSYLTEPYIGKVDYVAAKESLGFILGTMVADKLGVGLIPIRNGNIAVLPDEDCVRASYIDHNDTARSLQIRKSNFPAGSRVLLVDIWVETGVTLQSCLAIMEQVQGTVVGVVALGADKNANTETYLAENRIRSIVIKD